jgi:hypothetical protein
MEPTSTSSEPLVCPRCATRAPLEERFCPNCSMPLTYAGPDPARDDVTDRQRLARKIKPQLAEGELVKVAGARNQVEAEFVQSLLLEEGVPSTLRRARGFDVPDFLAAGPRDILVPASGADVARDVLLQSDLGPVLPGSGLADRPVRLLVGVLAAFAFVALVVWLGSELLG